MLRYEHGGDIYEDTGIILDFSVNTNPLGMPAGAKEALTAALGDFERYPDCHCRALRQALSRQHGLERGMILCGNGAADMIFRLCACLKPKKALALAPTFSEYERPVRLFGGEMLEYRLQEAAGFALLEGILQALTPEVDIFFLCNPNNPTGRLASPALLRRLAQACTEMGILLVVDECFLDFTAGDSLLPLLGQYPRLLILRAFTKLYGMAGLRLGYLLCADEALLARIAAFGAEWSVSAAAQAAGLGALAEPGWVERTRCIIQAERAFLQEGLTALGLTIFPSDANFLLVKSALPLYVLLKQRGILVRGCNNFTGLDDHFIRIGLKTHEKNVVLLSAVKEVLHG
ncbi:MAG: threonine-phosphate decarboxylase CobD [Candidatus Pelethousia sp.]|nr:threonine-phosphate decarboxylase CobD [Candidatus Pelethousia sp.]